MKAWATGVIFAVFVVLFSAMVRYRLLVGVGVLLILYVVQAIGQPYHFRHFQVEQGLSNNTVFCSVQDHQGFMWMGTKDGLNRYDGYTFKVFRNDPDDSLSLGDNFVRSLLAGKNKTLYAGTRNGLYAYHEYTETFTQLYATADEIREIAADDMNNLWFVAGQKLYCLGRAAKGYQLKALHTQYQFTSVACAPGGKVWAATADGLLLSYNKAAGGFKVAYKMPECEPPLPGWIEKITILPNGNILAGTASCGAFLYNEATASSRFILRRNTDRTGIFVRDFLPIDNSTIWIATESGIFIYNLEQQTFTHLEKQILNPFALSDNAVYTLCRDKEGGIWCGTYFGGINYNAQAYANFNILLPGNSPQNLSGQAVREMVEDDKGRLWIGTEDGGLNQYDRKTGRVLHFRSTGKPGDIAYPNLHALLAEGNRLWVGTFEHGLDLFDMEKGKVIQHFPRPGQNKLQSTFFVVLQRLQSGKMLAGTRRGLYIFNAATGEFEPDERIPPSCFVHAILQDHEGTIWIGTLGNGLYCLKPGRAPRHYEMEAADKTTLPANAVTTLFQDSAKRIWVGTEGGGLALYQPAADNFRRYTIKDGLPSNTIFKMLEDFNQNLWFTTSRGLVVFNPAKDSLKVYTTDHGLLSNQFNYNSGYRDKQGNLYFGSAKGLIYFNPQQFSQSTFAAPLHITGFSMAGKAIVPGGTDGILSKSLQFTRQIVLNYDQNSFSIDFASLSFTTPERTEYQYIMEGLDKAWTHLQTNRKVYFTNLAPGSYTFRVKAVHSSGSLPPETTSLQIEIRPPWWASQWAYTFYTLMGLLMSGLLLHNYHRAMNNRAARKLELMQHEKEKEIYKAKIDFFTYVAHEIKTPLTLIKAPLEQLLKRKLDNPSLLFELTMMERNTNRLLELTHQLLDFRKIESAGFKLSLTPVVVQEFLMERYQRFKTLSRQKNVHVELRLAEGPVTIMADWDAIQKITDNLLYNAISYSSSKVVVTMETPTPGSEILQVGFCNDGPAIPENMNEQIFEPFFRLQGSANKTGAGIGLSLARSLARLHHGNVTLLASTQGSTCFAWTIATNLKPELVNLPKPSLT